MPCKVQKPLPSTPQNMKASQQPSESSGSKLLHVSQLMFMNFIRRDIHRERERDREMERYVHKHVYTYVYIYTHMHIHRAQGNPRIGCDYS